MEVLAKAPNEYYEGARETKLSTHPTSRVFRYSAQKDSAIVDFSYAYRPSLSTNCNTQTLLRLILRGLLDLGTISSLGCSASGGKE